VANPVRQAVSLLKGDEYKAVVIDESMLESEPAAVDLLLLCAGTAIRVVREVRVALDRRRREQVIAVQLAVLHKELNGSLTGILLKSELALAAPLPSDAREKIIAVRDLAKEIRTVLATAALTPESLEGARMTKESTRKLGTAGGNARAQRAGS